MLVDFILSSEALGIRLSELIAKGYRIDCVVADRYTDRQIDPRIGYMTVECTLILTRGYELRGKVHGLE